MSRQYVNMWRRLVVETLRLDTWTVLVPSGGRQAPSPADGVCP